MKTLKIISVLLLLSACGSSGGGSASGGSGGSSSAPVISNLVINPASQIKQATTIGNPCVAKPVACTLHCSSSSVVINGHIDWTDTLGGSGTVDLVGVNPPYSSITYTAELCAGTIRTVTLSVYVKDNEGLESNKLTGTWTVH